MHPALALTLTTTVLVIVGIVSVVLLVLIIVAPSRRVREEPRLDKADETKLLLHRDPDEPTGEVSQVVVDLPDPDVDPEEPGATDLSDLADLSDRERDS